LLNDVTYDLINIMKLQKYPQKRSDNILSTIIDELY